jgi:glycine cleavage system regulatory protein
VALDLVGADRAGIVSQLTQRLAERGVSIEQLHTEQLAGVDGSLRFQVGAQLRVPKAVSTDTLRADLESLASAMQLDIALDDGAAV